ncbi:MAG: polyketide cyclase [Chloroflexi bacterium]|nr:MAG: polyketide cyclase [Chloroflexota bacterium]
MTDLATATHELLLTHDFAAPPELVFAAWTDPAQLAQWWGPEGFSTPSATLDVVPGGAWRTCMRRDADGMELWSRGEFREVEPPHRLVFTFAWEGDDGALRHETLVSVSFAAHAGGTRMTFRQSPFPTAQERDDHHGGWSECFHKLAGMLATR